MSVLSRFAVEEQPQHEHVVDLEFKFQGTMLACDQSISNTGFVTLTFPPRGKPIIGHWGTIKTEPTGIKGYRDYLMRVQDITSEVLAILDECYVDPALIVHEEPPMGGGMRKPESSLSVAVALNTIAVCRDIPVQSVHGKHAKKVLTGDGNAEKGLVRAAIASLVDLSEVRMNEHISDALAVGLVKAAEWEAA